MLIFSINYNTYMFRKENQKIVKIIFAVFAVIGIVGMIIPSIMTLLN